MSLSLDLARQDSNGTNGLHFRGGEPPQAGVRDKAMQ
jgi:hypothetical protein